MIEKFAASVGAVLAIVLGIWARVTFVRRSEIYAKDGKPVYRHANDCSELQQTCNRQICKKIEEVKTAQLEADKKRDTALEGIQGQLSDIQKFMGRVDQYIKDH